MKLCSIHGYRLRTDAILYKDSMSLSVHFDDNPAAFEDEELNEQLNEVIKGLVAVGFKSCTISGLTAWTAEHIGFTRKERREWSERYGDDDLDIVRYTREFNRETTSGGADRVTLFYRAH